MATQAIRLRQSARAAAVDYRTYRRPRDDAATAFESLEEMVERSFRGHHRRLWEEAGGEPDELELGELYGLGVQGLGSVAGRTRWLGGTPYAFDRAACMFNCSATEASTVFDVVDIAWLLLNGCGVGFKPRVGTLHGYLQPVSELQVIGVDAREASYRGAEANEEELPSADNGWTWTIRVGDSAQAWARAVGKLLCAPRAHTARLRLDFSEVRGAGGRLKGYGWICNGSAPLARAMAAIHDVMNRAAGQLLDEIQILDVVNWLGTILSSRRAAEICELDSHNPRFREFCLAKKDYFLCQDCGHWETAGGVCRRCGSRGNNQHRRQSNNTGLWWHKPTRRQIEELLRQADECGGDPGICNAEEAQRRCPWFTLANPCFAPGTLITTRNGALPVEQLVGVPVEVHDGSRWVEIDNFRVTGTNEEVLDVELQDGSVVSVTPYHTMLLESGVKVEARDLAVGDRLMLHEVECDGPHREEAAYLKGFLLGDGTASGAASARRPQLWVYHTKYVCVDRLVASADEVPPSGARTSAVSEVQALPDDGHGRRRLTGLSARKHELLEWVTSARGGLPRRAFLWDRRSKREFLAGLFDADGTAMDTAHGFGYQLTSTSLNLLRDVQTLLKSLGVRSKVGRTMPPRFDASLPGGGSYCQEAFRLTVAQAGSVKLAAEVAFERLQSFAHREVKYNVRPRAGQVVEVRPGGVRGQVYCCTVPQTHTVCLAAGVVTGQCHEILLPRSGFCNLVTACLPRFRRNFNLLERAVWLLARANYRQTCVDLEDGVLQPNWHQTQEALRLCGVSLTGIVQADWLTDYQIRRLRNSAVVGAYSMADELGLPRPKAVTTEKPEGTISKALGSVDLGEVAEGVNRPLGQFIFNWVNFSSHDPLVSLLESAGYKAMPNPSDPANVLVRFPVEYRGVRFDHAGGREVNLEPATDQLNRYLRWNTLWADHNVSATVSYSPDEIPQVADWVDQNWDRGFVACAFLRRVDPTLTARDLGHPYLPQEVVGRDEFLEYQSQLREVDWARVSGWHEIADEGCASGVCPTR